MGRSTTDNLPRVDRRALAAEWREWHARVSDFRERLGVEPSARCERAAALDRGEPVEVANWELPHHILPVGALAWGPHFYVIEPDGSITPVLGGKTTPPEKGTTDDQDHPQARQCQPG